MTEDEMVGWHHRLNGQESEQTQGDGKGWASPVCCRPWGCRESDTMQWLSTNPAGGSLLAGAPAISPLPGSGYEGSQTVLKS